MMQQPMVGSTGGMAGGQWGYQHMPGYVWGTPMSDSPMPLDRSSSWQVCASQSSLICLHVLNVWNATVMSNVCCDWVQLHCWV